MRHHEKRDDLSSSAHLRHILGSLSIQSMFSRALADWTCTIDRDSNVGMLKTVKLLYHPRYRLVCTRAIAPMTFEDSSIRGVRNYRMASVCVASCLSPLARCSRASTGGP